MIFTKFLIDMKQKRELEKKKKQSTIICDFLEFMKVNGLKFYTEVDLENQGIQMLKLDPNPELIDVWLINFFDVYDKIKKDK